MRYAVLFLLFSLFSCGGNNTTPTPPSGWTAEFSPGVGVTANGTGFSVTFPAYNTANCPGTNCSCVHYVTKATGPLRGTISASGNLAVTGTWQSYCEPGSPTSPGSSHTQLYFQRSGDDLSGQGQYAYYRWWCNPMVALVNGSITISCPLSDLSRWSSVMGEFANNSAAATAGFNQAMASAARVGMTFGGGSYAGHGVAISGGNASLSITQFTVQ